MSRLEVLQSTLQEALVRLNSREAQLVEELEQFYVNVLVDSQRHVATFAEVADEHGSRKREMHELAQKVKEVSLRASSLSERVKLLDRTLRNLREAKSFVTGLDDLDDVDSQIAHALDEGNLDSAARIVERFHEFEKAGFASALDPAVLERYKSYENRLHAMAKTDLEDAIREKQRQPIIEKLTRTLYSMGLESSAMDIYFDYIRGMFSDKCLSHTASLLDANTDSTRPVHVEAVTNIFLEVADGIQRHQKFVEELFGNSHFTSFLNRIESEAIAHSGRAIRALMKATNVAQNQVAQENAGDLPAASLDMCLEELVTIVMRCKRFTSYMQGLCGVEGGDGSPKHSAPTGLQQLVEEISGAYVAGEQALMTCLFTRAVIDDAVDTQDACATWSSVVDDSFYIFKKALDRALLTGDSNCACAVVNNISNLIQLDLKQFIEDSFEASKRLFASYSLTIGRAYQDHALEALFNAKQEESGSGVTRIIRSADSLPHALSNIGVSCAYVSRFKSDCLECYDRVMPKRSERRAMFQQCLGAFDSITGELGDLHTNCLKYLLQQMRGAFISPFVSAIDNVNFDVNDAGFGDMQVNDPFMKAFIASLDTLVGWVKAATAPETSNQFLSLLCDYIALRMERSIGQSRSQFSLLGATQLYQDVARMVAFFAESTDVAVKLKFGRLQELCSIMCLDSLAEFRQIYGDGSSLLQTYKISSKDVRTILSLRSDFSHDAIAATII
jgi:hypothetical protein